LAQWLVQTFKGLYHIDCDDCQPVLASQCQSIRI
jgi:hypothetical protein